MLSSKIFFSLDLFILSLLELVLINSFIGKFKNEPLLLLLLSVSLCMPINLFFKFNIGEPDEPPSVLHL